MIRRLLLAVAVLAALGVPAARADVKLPAFFSDGMVLQQGMACPIWGTADPGEEVTVAINLGGTGSFLQGAGRQGRPMENDPAAVWRRRPVHPDRRGQEQGHDQGRLRRRGLGRQRPVEHGVVG